MFSVTGNEHNTKNIPFWYNITSKDISSQECNISVCVLISLSVENLSIPQKQLNSVFKK